MKASQRPTALGLALLAVLLVALLWFSANRRNPGRSDSAEPVKPVASSVPDQAHQLTVEVYSHGKPLSDAGVLVQHVKLPEVFSSVRSDSRGRVVFPSLPSGPYRVTAMHFGFGQKTKEIRLQNPDQRLRLALPRAEALPAPSASAAPQDTGSGTLSGRVVNERGEPVPRAQVGVSSSAAPVFIEADDTGHFEFTNLGAPRLNLFATAPGYASAQLPDVAAGSTSVEIVMHDPASLQGSVELVSRVDRLFVRLCHQDPVYKKELCIKSKYSSPPNTTYQLDRLPAGEFDVVFSNGEQELGRVPVKLRSGEQVVVPTQRL